LQQLVTIAQQFAGYYYKNINTIFNLIVREHNRVPHSQSLRTQMS